VFGGGSGPAWLAVVIACEDWGKAPWEITGRDTPELRRRWFMRWHEYARLRTAKASGGK
jgi:hypothetical protein